jgi:hypothetical protein
MKDSSLLAGQLLLLGAIFLGCGSDDDKGSSTCSGVLCGGAAGGGGGNTTGAGTCNAAAACGGTLDGSWQVDGVCIEGDLSSALVASQNLPAACSNIVQSVTPTMTGTVTFADGMETDNFTQTISATVLYTEACMSADARLCSCHKRCRLHQRGVVLGEQYSIFSTATCSLAGSNCACSMSQQSQIAHNSASVRGFGQHRHIPWCGGSRNGLLCLRDDADGSRGGLGRYVRHHLAQAVRGES